MLLRFEIRSSRIQAGKTTGSSVNLRGEHRCHQTRLTGRGRLERISAWYRGAAIGVLNTLVVLLILNLALFCAFAVRRSIERAKKNMTGSYLRYPEELLARAYPGLDPTTRDAMLKETRERPLVYEPYTHYEEGSYAGQFVNVHRRGFRSNGTAAPWPMPSYRATLWFFGGSTAFGYGVADWETIPHYLEKELQRTDLDMIVYNFGQGGYYSSQELALFTKLVRAGDLPDYVVFLDGLNEVIHHSIDAPIYEGLRADQPRPAFAFLEETSLARFVRILRRRMTVGSGAQVADPIGAEPGNLAERSDYILERWRANCRMERAIAADLNIETLFVWQPVPSFRYPKESHIFADSLTQDLSSLLPHVYGTFERHIATWTSTDDLLDLSGIQEGRRESLYVDRVHYSADFNREIASRISRRVAADLLPAED